MLVTMVTEIFYPTAAFALSGGPSQPEVESFEPIGTTDMVDPFSGDFSYNIPLLNVGNYPINISYHAGPGMDQEASWTGLGWNINPGVISRNMRGLPDDFDGSTSNPDKISKEFNIKTNRTYGVTTSASLEIFGLGTGNLGLAASAGIGIKYNNYRGFGLDRISSVGITAGKSGSGQMTGSLGMNSSSDGGLTISPSVSYSANISKVKEHSERLGGTLGIGTSFNNRQGLTDLTLNYSLGRSVTENRKPDPRGKFGGFEAADGRSMSSISFVTPSYTPNSEMPLQNTSVTLSFKMGATILALHPMFQGSGYYSEQRLKRTSDEFLAFGYFNSEKGMKYEKALHDFNREKDGTFSKNSPTLPITNYTYDVYSVSGQGIGGVYRPFRSDVGYMYDSRVDNTSGSYSIGAEIGAGNAFKVGVDVRVNDVTTTTSRWAAGNDLAKKLRFVSKKDAKDDFYEPFYFKQAGEKSVDPDYYASSSTDLSFVDRTGGLNAVRPVIESTGGLDVKVQNMLQKSDGGTVPVNERIRRKRRQKRNENISFLSVKEAKLFAVDKEMFNTQVLAEKNDQSIKNTYIKDHYIGEITSINTQGVRYVYGIPAYNTRQVEKTFAVQKPGTFPGSGICGYDPNDVTRGNKKGLDNYYSMTEVPAYAHSYLITSVLSPDFVDNDGVAGPSKGDMGSYTKFNYDKVVKGYKWRTPMTTAVRSASYNEGMKSASDDDKANVTYGEKDIWQLTSVEDKNYIAIFETGNRADGFGAKGLDGEIDDVAGRGVKSLKTIKLYYKKEYDKDNANAIPIKTVHFEYDYSLCKGVPNNTGKAIDINGNWLAANAPGNINTPKMVGSNKLYGKLTLKKIYFTYQNSNKAKFSPYEFTYGSSDAENPDYDIKCYDRWANYKAYPQAINTITPPELMGDHPYTDQNKTKTDISARAWNLSKINLPSGGSIEVTYESDDYAYVQDKQAMQMFKIIGINNTGTGTSGSLRSGGDFASEVRVDLGKQVSESDFRNKYLKGITDNVYFRIKANVGSQGKADEEEFVPGYCQVDIANCRVEGNIGIIKVNKANMGEKLSLKVHPFTMAILQFSRIHTSRIANNQPSPGDGAVDQVIKAIINSDVLKNMLETVAGINTSMVTKGFGQTINVNQSYIRLLSPEKMKLGGGHRVKQIEMKDAAQAFSMNAADNSYGQVYEYTTHDDDLDAEVSSGVASYEPMIGGEENPLKLPIGFSKDNLLIPDERFYIEGPFGESFYPAASVGYAKVKISSLNSYKSRQTTTSETKYTPTGYIIHEYYTAKDFPVIASRTGLNVIPKKSPAILRLLKIKQKDYLYASQGFAVEINDMHGKPKAQWVYAEGGKTYISGVEYKYKQDGNRLNNSSTVIAPDGTLKKADIGIDYDFVMDMRQQQTDIVSVGLNGNLAGFLVAIFPGLVGLILPAYAEEHTKFKSAVATKVISRSGILEETIAYDLGSKVSTKNLAWDGETGDVLTTQVTNNFEDPIYNQTYPAHWAYDGMGPSYINIGLEKYLQLDDPGEFVVTNPNASASASQIYMLRTSDKDDDPFEVGDEVIITWGEMASSDDADAANAFKSEMKYRFWVVMKQTGSVFLMGGNPNSETDCKYFPQGKISVKIIRSGRRNMSSIPVGSITTLLDPLKDQNGNAKVKLDLTTFDHKVLNASATEFSDEWNTYCGCTGSGPVQNLIYSGQKANWRPKRSYAYLTSRTKTAVEARLRKDGPYTSFNTFWKVPTLGLQWAKNDLNWKWVNEITQYDPYSSAEVENKDALNRFSTANTGYSHQVPTSVSTNAKHADIFFDNFETYSESPVCEEIGTRFLSGTVGTSSPHTGRHSLKVPKGNTGATLNLVKDCK